MISLTHMGLNDMADLHFKCRCGKEHGVEIKKILVGDGVIHKITDILSDYEGKRVFIIEDANTYDVAGKKTEELLLKKFEVDKYIFREKPLVADERALGSLIIEMPRDTDIIIAVGSGTINDLARFISYKLNVPYMVVATAPSMDGYASVVSPLVVSGIKTTFAAVYPYAIIADIDIMKDAPKNMLQAGFGDILGKYTALADWQLAKIIKKEYICEEIELLVQSTINKCIEFSMGIHNRDPKSIESITEALILSGIAIGMAGSSRPASGEEHHLSHCWEMIFMNEGNDEEWLHGNKVGVGVGIITYLYHYLKTIDINMVYESGGYKQFNYEKWADNLRFVYGKNADGIISFKEDSIEVQGDIREKNMRNIIEHWEEITNIYIPDSEEIIGHLKTIGAVYHPRDMGIEKELFERSLIAAKDIRKRYGVLQLLEDIGMLETAAEEITRIYYGEEP